MAYFNDSGKNDSTKEDPDQFTEEEYLTLILRPMLKDVGNFQMNRSKLYPLRDTVRRQRISKYLNQVSESPLNRGTFLGRFTQYNYYDFANDVNDALPFPVTKKEDIQEHLSNYINKLLDFAKKQKFSDEQTTDLIYNFVDKFFQNQLTTLSDKLLKVRVTNISEIPY